MATVRKHRGNWVADYRDQHGGRHRERPPGTFDNLALQRKAAQDLLAKRLGEITRSDYRNHDERLTFSQVCDHYLASKVNVRPSTRRSYQSVIDLYLRPYFGSWKVHEISAMAIEQYRAGMSTGLPDPIAQAFLLRIEAAKKRLSQARAKQRVCRAKPGIRTINKTLTLLVMIFNFATRHRWVDQNPAECIEKIRDTRTGTARPLDSNILTPNEARLVVESADPGRRDRNGALITNNYQLLIMMGILTGMRQGELLGLQWGDIDWHARQVHVRRAWKDGAYSEPKTRTSNRRIDLPQMLLPKLKEWRLGCPKGGDDLVFPNLNGRPMSHTNLLQRGFHPALRRAGLRKIRFHDLRHTFASIMIANGEDIVRVSRMLGHASPSITLNVYSHMLPKEHYGGTDRMADLISGSENPGEARTIASAGASSQQLMPLRA